MFTALIIKAEPGDTTAVYNALRAAGCMQVQTISSANAQSLGDPRRELRELIVMYGLNMRVLRELDAGDAPIMVLCAEREIDAAFLAGATECVTLPVRERELEGRIRRTMRARGDARHRRDRERLKSEAIKALSKEKQELEQLVSVDPLTGVATRRHALGRLDTECNRAARDGLSLGLVMIDLDFYHAYNERYGHLGGDQCLQRVATAMNKCLRRPADFLGRYGGEEFIAVLPNTDIAGARCVAESLRAAVEALGIAHEGSSCAKVVTITAGFTAQPVVGGTTAEDLIEEADLALLRAKRRGRNRVGGGITTPPETEPATRPSAACVQ